MGTRQNETAMSMCNAQLAIRIKAAQFSVSGGSNRFIDLGLELLTYEKEGGG